LISSFAQPQDAKSYPHPYAEAMFDLGGAGYGPGELGRVGVDTEEKHFISDFSVAYDTTGKNGDVAPISKGHTRTARGNAFVKFNNWYVGVGAGFGETLTTDYNKYSWHPSIGGGRDFYLSHPSGYSSFRIQAMYLREINEFTRYPVAQTTLTPPPGWVGAYTPTTCKCGNNVQGVDLNAWFPSPANNHHFFIHMDLTPLWFHQTVTDPLNTQPWVAAQRRNIEADSTLSLGIIARF
jgi:hypothetical protein